TDYRASQAGERGRLGEVLRSCRRYPSVYLPMRLVRVKSVRVHDVWPLPRVSQPCFSISPATEDVRPAGLRIAMKPQFNRRTVVWVLVPPGDRTISPPAQRTFAV